MERVFRWLRALDDISIEIDRTNDIDIVKEIKDCISLQNYRDCCNRYLDIVRLEFARLQTQNHHLLALHLIECVPSWIQDEGMWTTIIDTIEHWDDVEATVDDQGLLRIYAQLMIFIFLQELGDICALYGFNLPEIAQKRGFYIDVASSACLGDYKVRHLDGRVFLNATYRRAAVLMLIQKTGICKDVDRTQIAAFVEAVTGGNINVKPQDSVSYKTPTKKAEMEAAVWLKRINIE
ncbi:hypothetical protein [Alistipes putredinis]|uniref:hypothetical protein n=1 Tax=Alistipes putredinis TaxID=28117 RepID=UPI003AF111CE